MLGIAYSCDATIPASSVPSVFDSDRHADKTVTLFRPSITIQDALHLLTTETGVSLDIRDLTEDGEYKNRKLCLSVRNLPLHSLAEALSALLSYKNFGWRWSIRTIDGVPHYTLVPFGDSQQAIAAMRSQIDAEFSRTLSQTADLADYSDNRLKRFAARNTELSFLAQASPNLLENWRAALQVFNDKLTEDQRQKVLSGGATTLSLTPSKPSPSWAQLFPSIPLDKLSVEKTMTMSLQRSPDELSPRLIVLQGESYGQYHFMPRSYNLIGGNPAENAWRDRVGLNWTTRHDAPSDPVEQKEIAPPDSTSEEKEDTLRTDTLARLLRRITAANGTPVIALRPEANRETYSGYDNTDSRLIDLPPYGHTLQELIEALKNPEFQYHHKWREGVLLLRNPIEPYLAPHS